MCSHCDGHPDEEKFVREFNERRAKKAPLEGQELIAELFQRILAYCDSTARTRNLTGYLQSSSPLVGVHKLTQSFEEIQ